MPASEYAYGPNHPATRNTFVDKNGNEVRRRTPPVETRAQLSEIAMGPGDVDEKSYVRPPRPEQPHDHNPDA